MSLITALITFTFSCLSAAVIVCLFTAFIFGVVWVVGFLRKRINDQAR